MGATKVGVITEGPVHEVLVAAFLQRIARERAHFEWPLLPDDATEFVPTRKRGHGGVLDAVKRLVSFVEESVCFNDRAFFVIVLDHRTKAVQERIRKIIRGSDRFIVGIAIEEMEAWWLGDRVNTLAWLQLSSSLPPGARYAAPGYTAEKDKHPKRTLDELTMISTAVTRRYGQGNTEMAREFAQVLEYGARLDDIEGQCPRGFGAFCRDTTNAMNRAKARTGRLF
jgi:hypothetical protein